MTEAPVAFDNMQGRQLKGTSEWTEDSIVLPLNRAAKRLVFGVLASGTGRAWADDLRLLVDGKPIADVPRVEPPKTVVDVDKEFDGGSGIALQELTKIQIANLAMLGKVWGFLKYHHPLVTAGKRHWDYELFRILPRVLNAADAPAARSAINQWIAGLGPVPPCAPCATLVEAELHLRPPVTWLTDDRAWRRARCDASRGLPQSTSGATAVLRLAGAQHRQSVLRPRAGVSHAEGCPTPVTSCSRCIASGTSSNTGFPIVT